MMQLKNISYYVNDKIDISSLIIDDYISTDSMLPNKQGINPSEKLPETKTVTWYRKNDILVSNIRPYFKKIWFSNKTGGCSNDVLAIRSIKPSETDPKYLYYLLSQDTFFDYVMSGSNGTKMPRGNKTHIREFVIPVFSFEKQHRIADILSAYDNQIENNQKQIKLLEETAMRLYKEWFINLRFPGYESTKVVDGVPEGWEYSKMHDWVEVNQKNISKDYPNNSINYIDIGSVNCGRIEQKTEYILSEAPGRAKRIAADGDTVWGMVRPNLKAYALVLSPGINDVYSTGFAILTPIKIPYTFLYCTVTQNNFVSYLVNQTNGSAYPAVKPIHFEEAKILLPPSCLLSAFHNFSNPLFRKSHCLDNQNRLLAEARDKLLPKLMNGEIEV